jgi:hypothetical protein
MQASSVRELDRQELGVTDPVRIDLRSSAINQLSDGAMLDPVQGLPATATRTLGESICRSGLLDKDRE